MASARAQLAIDASFHKRVCVCPYLSIGICNKNSSSYADFTGFEPELFKKVADMLYQSGNLEWAPGNWSFYCFPLWTPVFNDIQISDPSQRFCDIFLGSGITSKEISASNLKISTSEFVSGNRIMIHRPIRPTGIWTFLQPFEWRVWLMIFGTSVVIALSVFSLEWTWHHGYSFKRAPSSSQAWRGYSSLQWGVTGQSLSSVYQLAPRSPGGRVVVLTSAFAAFILALAYASAYTAMMNSFNAKPSIQSYSDLKHSTVGIWDGDMAVFNASDFKRLVPLLWDTDQDEADILNRLRTGRVSALIFDVLFVESVVSSKCEFIAVGEILFPSSMGWLFPPETSDSYILPFDSLIERLKQQGDVQHLASKFIFNGAGEEGPQCDMSGLQFITQTKLGEVGGLWVVLASCLGLGLIVTGIRKTLRVFLTKKEHPSSQASDMHLDKKMGQTPEVTGNSSVSLQSACDRIKDMKRVIEQLQSEFDAKMDDHVAQFKSKLALTVLNGPGKGKMESRTSSPSLDLSTSKQTPRAQSEAARITTLALLGSADGISSEPAMDHRESQPSTVSFTLIPPMSVTFSSHPQAEDTPKLVTRMPPTLQAIADLRDEIQRSREPKEEAPQLPDQERNPAWPKMYAIQSPKR